MNKVLVSEFFMEEGNLRKNGIFYPIKLNYYKTEEIEEETGKEKYGIEIVKTEYQKDISQIDVGRYNNLSYNESKIDELLEIFKRNEVTAVGAQDCILDFFK